MKFKSNLWAVIDPTLPTQKNLIDVKVSREEARDVKRSYLGEAKIVRYDSHGIVR